MADSGSFNADLGINMQFNIDGAGLVEMTKTIKEISKGKDLQRYWKDVEAATDSAAKAIERYNKNTQSKGLAENFLKQINALKAITNKENMTDIFPNMDINFDELIESAKKLAPKINAEFSSSNFSQAFKTFDLLKDKGIELGEVFSKLSDYSSKVDENFKLRRENNEFKDLFGEQDIDKIKKDLSEIQKLRNEAEETFNNFLSINKIEKTDYWGDEQFSEYFNGIRNGSLTATEAIAKFKTEYTYLLEKSFKSNNDTFGLDQLQAFSTKLDSIFHQVEETSNKINDIISNGVIAKSVQNLSEDPTLSDSQRSIFGNILQDEESLKSITALFQKLIDETSQTKNTEVFNTEQFAKIESLFTSIESSLSSIKGVLVDVGDGEELSPLLKQLDNIREATSNIKLSLNLDLGNEVSERLNQKVSQSTQRQLEAYRKLFSAMKGTGKTNKEMLKFFEPDEASATELIGVYQGIIKRAEEKFKVGNSNIYKKLLGSTYDDLKKEIKNANAQLGRAENKHSENGILGDLFGNSKDLSGVIEQLNTIVSKLDEISVSAKGFAETFKNGLNVNTSVEEIEKLTNRVKELESELAKIKTPTTIPSKDMKDAFPKTSENLEQVAKSEQKVQQEAVATDKAFDNISFTPNTEGFEDIIAKFGILREQAEQITKIVKTTKQTAGGTPDISYKATLKNGSSYYLGENSTPQVLNASETVYDAKAVAKNAEQEAKAIQAEWDKNIKAIQDYMDAVTKLNNLKAKDKGTGSQANQIALQTQNIEKLKQVAFEARQNLSSMQAENPDIIAWKQWVDMMELFDQASKGSAESAAKLKDVLNNIKVPSLDKYENKLASYQTKKAGYDATIARFNDGGWTSDEYLKNVQAVKDAVKKYEDLLSNIKAKGGIANEEDVQHLKEYESEIKKTISTVTNMSAAEKGYNFVSAQKELDKIHKLLNENSKMSSEAKAKIQAYYREIESGNPSMSLDKIHGEILKIYNAEVEAGRAGRSFIDTLKNSGFHQIAAQMAGMFGVYDVVNLGKQAFSTVKELDYALVDLKKTTAMNSSELEQFYYDSNDVAKQMGVTTKEIIDQASSWSRLGYNSKQAATEMAKLSSQFALISPGMDTTTSQEGLVSIMKAWDIGYQDVKSQIMDDINALGNAMAEDNQDIVEGMERSAAALAAVGTSTKDAFALFSGIQEVLQNSEKSGTSLRSVALRLRSFDETTGEYSEDLANITGELADLTKTAEHAQGVSVFKHGSTTEFKSLVDYFREIADIWDEMSQKQQNDFLLKAFGRTQAQAGAALIQNFKGVEKALDVMDNAAGSADKEMETAKQSITYKLNELRQTWVGTVQDIANRDDLGKIVDGLIDLSSAIGFVIDKLGLVGTVGLFGGAGTGIFKFIKNFDWVFKPYTKTLSNSF